jgi:pimeloyl-ACP methyl ester carboxylesterase
VAAFCLLHGAWHDGACWDGVALALRARGHVAVAPDLPFHDPSADVARRVAPAIDALDGVQGPVVVVGHSMGCAYAPAVAAARPWSLRVDVCPGLGTLRPGFPWPAAGPDGMSAWDPDAAIAALYGRLPAGVARALAARLRPMAPAPDGYPTAARPAAVIVLAADDELFALEGERAAARALRAGPVIELPAGHMPMVEDPAGLAAALDLLVGGS